MFSLRIDDLGESDISEGRAASKREHGSFSPRPCWMSHLVDSTFECSQSLLCLALSSRSVLCLGLAVTDWATIAETG